MHPRSAVSFRIALAAGLVLAAAPAQAQQSLVSRTPPADVAAFSRAVASPGQTVTTQPMATDTAANVAVSAPAGPTMERPGSSITR